MRGSCNVGVEWRGVAWRGVAWCIYNVDVDVACGVNGRVADVAVDEASPSLT